MTERTTETEITFMHPFNLKALEEPLEAGTYRLVVDEELIEGLSFAAYRRMGTHLEIPAIAVGMARRQFLQVSTAEIAEALARDAPQTENGPRFIPERYLSFTTSAKPSAPESRTGKCQPDPASEQTIEEANIPIADSSGTAEERFRNRRPSTHPSVLGHGSASFRVFVAVQHS